MFPRYEEDTGTYVMTVFPALENFPTDDVLADLTRVNAIMEEQARKVPEQYWWIHRRFKTRPPGEPPFYD
jgi:KDO2-lipid IV(A) lauroyltransferase